MKKTQKNMFLVAGTILTILGITGSIPSFLNEQYTVATLSAIFVIGGIILLAVGFGD